MPAPETGKQRASRIQLDYYKHPDRLQSVKLLLTLAALVPALLWLVAGLVFSKQGQELYARGPVATVHAAWENNCEACHTPFQPLSGENLLNRFVNNPHASDQKCSTCHAGPIHHEKQSQHDTPSCAGCHRDHQGRNASLVRLADVACTHCHNNLSGHMSGTSAYQDSVTVFDGDAAHHPEFRSVRDGKDPGNLKFNHVRHLTAGLVQASGGQPMKLSDITDEAQRNRYARLQGAKDLQSPVQLDCAACHQPEAPAAASAPTSGAYMAPINYDNHCRACHPLTLSRTEPAGDRATVIAVPHGLQPEDVRSYLWGAYAEKATAPLRQRPASKRPLPGQPPMTPEDEQKIRKVIDQAVAEADSFLRLDAVKNAEKILFRGKTTCGECHLYEKNRPQSSLPERIKPTNIPAFWLRSARFSHASHQAVECRTCHPRADTSEVHSDVLIPGKAACLDCHAPLHTANGKARGGARFDCTECHDYHHREGDAARSSGGGARKRAAPHPGTIDDFLSGTLKPAAP